MCVCVCVCLGRGRVEREGWTISTLNNFTESIKSKRILLQMCLLFSGCREGSIRLLDGNSVREGRVEFCLNSRWGTVCDNGWDRVDASIVCRQLGFSSAGTYSY